MSVSEFLENCMSQYATIKLYELNYGESTLITVDSAIDEFGDRVVVSYEIEEYLCLNIE